MSFLKYALFLLVAGSVPVFAGTADVKWDFESSCGDWGSWGVSAESGISAEERDEMVTLSENAPRDGKKCLLMKDEVESANPYLALRKPIPVDPKKKYYFKGYIKSGDANPVPAAVVIAAEGNGKFLRWISRKVDVTEKWSEFSIESGDLPAGTTHLRPSVCIFGGNAQPSAKGSVYVDSLSFGEIDSAKTDVAKAVNKTQ